jgi:hypothetical protein
MKRKFKEIWTTIPPISTKQTTTSHLNSLNINNTTIFGVANPSIVIGQPQTYGGVINICYVQTIILDCFKSSNLTNI